MNNATSYSPLTPDILKSLIGFQVKSEIPGETITSFWVITKIHQNGDIYMKGRDSNSWSFSIPYKRLGKNGDSLYLSISEIKHSGLDKACDLLGLIENGILKIKWPES